MAYRGNIPLEGIEVGFQIEASPRSPAGFGVRKTLTLSGRFSETEQLRLRRASEYCPVGQVLMKGAVAITDEVVAAGEGLPVPAALRQEDAPAAISGEVRARYLAETAERSAGGALEQEGEVELYLGWENRTRPGRCVIVAGHSSQGWVPPPVPLAHAALASSSAATLQHLAPDALRAAGPLRVETLRRGTGNRDQAQADAAEGNLRRQELTRRAVLDGPAADAGAAIWEALLRDPVYRALRQGGILLDEAYIWT